MHHKTWPGTLTLSAKTLIALIEDIADSLDRTGFKRMLVVNGHGGNEGALLSACNSLICRGIGMGYVNYFNPGRLAWLNLLPGQHRDLGHACAYETSMQMALKPDQRSIIAERSAHLEPRLAPSFSGGGDLAELRHTGLIWSWLYNPGDRGYYGDPAAAREGNPDDVLNATVGALATFFDNFSDAPLIVGPRG
jgi:creatinine amidohydrolase